MRLKAPTAVLIHGHHLQAPEWEKLVWGNEDLSEVGRIPRGIEVAIKESTTAIIWGTGASVDVETDKKESEYTYSFALDRAEQLALYLESPQSEIVRIIQEKSVLQLETKNTKEEIKEAFSYCQDKGIRTLYLVSSPTHISRCLLTACQLSFDFPNIFPCAVPADTYTDFWHPKDVVVVEPSHRPDRSDVPMNALAKRLASARKYPESASRLYEDIKKRLDTFDEEINEIKK